MGLTDDIRERAERRMKKARLQARRDAQNAAERAGAALDTAADNVPTPITRTPTGSGYSGSSGVDRSKPPKDEYETYRELYRTNPIVGRAIDLRASEVVRPGYHIEIETASDTESGSESDDVDSLEESVEEWFRTSAIYAGEIGQPFLPLLWQMARNHDLDGEAMLEHVYDSPRGDGEQAGESAGDDDLPRILGLKTIDPSTVEFLTYKGTSMLVRPNDDPDQHPRLDADAPETDRGELAAFQQIPEGSSRWNDDDPEILLSQNDLTRIPRNPGFDTRAPTGSATGPSANERGNIRGASLVERVTEETKRLRARLQDHNASIASLAYPRAKIEFENYLVGPSSNPRKIIEWTGPDMEGYIDEFSRDDDDKEYSIQSEWTDPGGVIGSPPGVDVETINGDVPDISQSVQTSISTICSGLGVQKYRIGFGEDLNRRISEEQSEDFQRDIRSIRRRMGRKLSPIAERIAQQIIDDPESDFGSLELQEVRFRIETEESESAVRDEDLDAEKFKQIVDAIVAYVDSSAPAVVGMGWVEDELGVDFSAHENPDLDAISDELASQEIAPDGVNADDIRARLDEEADSETTPTPPQEQAQDGSDQTDTDSDDGGDGGDD